MTLNERVMRAVGSNDSQPPESRALYYSTDDDRRAVITGDNDGFELWFGTPHEWYHHMSSREVRLLARYLLVDWYIKSRWLGLRRPIYYWALRRHVNAWKASR